MTASPTVSSLLDQLTLEEKASLCLGSDFWHTAPVDRLCVPAVLVSDGPHGLRVQPARGDHVGAGRSLPATCFPTASALGSSWDPDLVRRVGAALGEEARAQGVAVVLGPGINIKRSPLCGRNFEYFSEDPHLSGALGTAMVEGVQSRGVGTSVKHFAANNQETDRLRVSADVDERTLREIYLPAFERVVTRGRPWTVMCAYNKVNGVYAAEHRWLLTELLRDEWGFDGLVVSDWGAVGDRVAALKAGLDLEMPPNLGVSDDAVVAAVRAGTLDEAALDAAAARVLQLVDRALASEAAPAPVDVDGHHALARAAAADCTVLLKNDGRLLPLRPAAGQTVAVIGEFARTPRYQGAGSSRVNPTRVDIALDELRAAVPDGVDVPFAAGFGVDTTGNDEQLAAEAVELARRADAVVAFLGLPAADESEGYDREHMDLPANQTALVPRLAEANANLVVVLANGSAVRLSGWEQHASSILECWLSGQAAGGAAADVLLGVADPAGRLAETLPLRLEDNPSALNFPGEEGHVRYGEGVFVGYRGYDALDQQVSYPFGHGLSYTRFDYADLSATVGGRAEDGDLTVDITCRVTNVGDRAGKEVVQLYVGDPEASVARPTRELKAFTKVDLAPGEGGPVAFRLTARDLSYWSTRTHGWALEGGTFELAVGASSRDLRLTTRVQIDAPPLRVPLDGDASLQEWLADPDGRELLIKEVGTDETGKPNGIVGDDARVRRIGNFPLNRLAAFPGMGITHDTVLALTEQLGAVMAEHHPFPELVIEVRANEFASAEDNPHVPLGAEAIVRDALDCAVAGAAMYHWHARGEDGIDRPDDIDLHRAVVLGLRGTGLILHPTLGFTSTQGDAASRLRTVVALNADPHTQVDIVPADVGAFVLDGWDAEARSFTSGDKVLLNTTGYLDELLGALHRERVRVLAVVWSPGAVRSALRFRQRGILPAPTFWQLGFTGPASPGGPPATPGMLSAYLEQIPPDEPWTVHVRDGRCLDMAEWAIARGGHVSIGLGDDPYEDLGFPTNADLVRAVADLAAQHGRPVADPVRARSILRFA